MSSCGENFSEKGIIDELRSLRGALNAKGFGDEGAVTAQIATLQVQVQHLQNSVREMKTALWSMAAGVIGLVIKMVIEGSLLK